MAPGSYEKKKDRRALVLLALGTAIITAAWIAPEFEPRGSEYYPTAAAGTGTVAVIRTAADAQTDAAITGRNLSQGLSCADTPPRLAIFFDLPLPVNRSAYGDLTRLPGIGPRLAGNIIEYRSKNGDITGPKALGQISGIGRKMTAKLLPLICFD